MNCPNDQSELRRVTAASHYGQPVILDQCPTCGGIWFDHFELYEAKLGQADTIELLDPDILRTPSVVSNAGLRCPRDRTNLVRFTDLLFPKDIIIARCPACNGFWLNRGEFTRYQRYRESFKKPGEAGSRDEELEQEIERLLAEHKAGTTPGSLENLGRFLSTQLDPVTWSPLDPDQLSDKEHGAFNVVINAVSLLLRLFIRL